MPALFQRTATDPFWLGVVNQPAIVPPELIAIAAPLALPLLSRPKFFNSVGVVLAASKPPDDRQATRDLRRDPDYTFWIDQKRLQRHQLNRDAILHLDHRYWC